MPSCTCLLAQLVPVKYPLGRSISCAAPAMKVSPRDCAQLVRDRAGVIHLYTFMLRHQRRQLTMLTSCRLRTVSAGGCYRIGRCMEEGWEDALATNIGPLSNTPRHTLSPLPRCILVCGSECAPGRWCVRALIKKCRHWINLTLVSP